VNLVAGEDTIGWLLTCHSCILCLPFPLSWADPNVCIALWCQIWDLRFSLHWFGLLWCDNFNLVCGYQSCPGTWCLHPQGRSELNFFHVWHVSELTQFLVSFCQNQLAVLCPNFLPWTKVGGLKLKWTKVSHCSVLPRDSLCQHSGEAALYSDWHNFNFIEPVGSSIPKFPTMDNVRGFQVMRDQSFTLLCPAQGFPVPTYR
jgi:hypothetical protein